MRRAWLGRAFTLSAMAAIALIQLQFDHSTVAYSKANTKAAINLAEPLVPQPKVLELMSLGQPQAMADILWLQLIQYFGSGNPYGKYNALGPMLDRITTLDPKYEYAYHFGMVVLPFMDNADMAIKLGERAQINLPNDGLLTYMHATNYHLYKKDYAKASYYYEKSSHLPGAPRAALQLAALTKSKVDDNLVDRQAAIYFWQVVGEQAKTDDEIKMAKNWEIQMTMVYLLEKSAIDYKTKYGSYPTSMLDLKNTGYISGIPVSPVGRIFDIDPKTGKVSFDRLAES